ncbi:MAG: spore germination protein [Syntrophomonadaceae bacterium]|nr:spore germination protein [Syntrophomonadaceae bacterium]
MFKWLAKVLNGQTKNQSTLFSGQKRKDEAEIEIHLLSKSLEQNRAMIEEIFDHCDDLIIHKFVLGPDKSQPAMLVYIDSLIKDDLLQIGLMQALQNVDYESGRNISLSWLKDNVIPTGRVTKENNWIEVTDRLCKESVALFIDGHEGALLIDYPAENNRPVSQPVTQTSVMGPAEAFNEDIYTNMGLLRKRFPTSRLAVEKLEIGLITKTPVNIVYLKGNVTTELIREVKTRLNRIKVDSILSSGQIEEHIQDSPYSLFSGIDSTERPDRLASILLQGGAALIIGGTPFALLFPTTLANQMTASDDYANRYWYASFIRLVRWSALFTAAMAPGLYVAIISFHQELIPPSLLFTVASNREGVPFPAFLEAFLMELTFETLREAGVRMPRTFGQTISIVGTIVVGQAAVSAGLVSSGMVVVVALTAIASYTIPSMTLSNSIRLLRFFFMFAGAFMGLFGIMAAVSLLSFHVCSVRTFGVPHLSPLAPLSLGDFKDTFVRVPNWMMRNRPQFMGRLEPERQNAALKPHPPPKSAGKSRNGKGKA